MLSAAEAGNEVRFKERQLWGAKEMLRKVKGPSIFSTYLNC